MRAKLREMLVKGIGRPEVRWEQRPLTVRVFIKKKKKAIRGFPGHSVVKNPPANARDKGSILSLGRSHTLQSSQAHEPQLLSLCSRAREDTARRGSGAATKSSPHSPQLEKNPSSNKDPAQPKMNE